MKILGTNMELKTNHPFSPSLIILGVCIIIFGLIYSIWQFVAPTVSQIVGFMPLIITIGIAALIWYFAKETVKNTYTFLRSQKWFVNTVKFALLTTIYGGLLYGIYYAARELQGSTGVEYRTAWTVTTVIGFFIAPVFWKLYAAAGIPGDAKVIRQGLRTTTVGILAFMAWLNYVQPNYFFNHQTGNPVFWVDDAEGQIYYTPGFSPVTGKKLRPGTVEDTQHFKQQPLLDELGSTLRKAGEKVTSSALASSPLPEVTIGCANYDGEEELGLSHRGGVGIINSRHDCPTPWIQVPRGGNAYSEAGTCIESQVRYKSGKLGDWLNSCRTGVVRHSEPFTHIRYRLPGEGSGSPIRVSFTR